MTLHSRHGPDGGPFLISNSIVHQGFKQTKEMKSNQEAKRADDDDDDDKKNEERESEGRKKKGKKRGYERVGSRRQWLITISGGRETTPSVGYIRPSARPLVYSLHNNYII